MKNKIKILISEEQIKNRIQELALELNASYGEKEVVLICVLKGSVFFAIDLAKELKMPLKMEFIKLSSYGSETQSSGKVKAIDLTLPDLNGKNVLVVEDIVDTGYTAKFLKDFMLSSFNLESYKLCTLLDKKSTRKVDITPDYYGFDIEDNFVIGYGLDYDQHYRNLKYIGELTLA